MRVFGLKPLTYPLLFYVIITPVVSFSVTSKCMLRQYPVREMQKTILDLRKDQNVGGYYDSEAPLIRRDKYTPRYMSQEADSTSSQVSVAKKSTGEAILGLAVPALGALLIDPLMTLVDTVFVGRFAESANALAGMGTAASILTSSFFLFNFLCTATTPIVSSRRAAGKESEALAVGGQALTLAFFLGTIVCIGLSSLSQPLLHVMGTANTGPVANEYATSFFLIRGLAAPAIFVISASSGILRGYLDTKTPVVILVLSNVVNLVMDALLIPGAGLGPMGAAIATTTSEWFSAILFLCVLAGRLPSADGELGSNHWNEKPGSSLSVVPTLSIPAWTEIKPLIVASSSVFLRSSVLQLSLLGAAAMAARGGEIGSEVGAAESVAAHQIAIQLWLLGSFVCDALAAASQGLVADALGREDKDDVRDITKTVFFYSLVQGVALACVLQIGSYTHFLLDAFTSDPGTQAALQKLLFVLVFAQPLNSFVFAADGVLQGASEFTYQAKAMALSGSVAVIAFVSLQYFGDHADTLVHVWYSLIMLQIMRGLTSLVKIVQHGGPIDLFSEKLSS